MGGESTDDDIQNGSGEYSWHGVEGEANDLKLNYGIKMADYHNIKLFLTSGIFYKNIKVITVDGYGKGGSYGSGISFAGRCNGTGRCNYTNTTHIGGMIGIRGESKTVRTNYFIQTDFLLPIYYKGKQIWYGRDPDLYWTLESNEYSRKEYGIRLQAGYGYNIENSFLKNVTVYTYYETINIDGLTEKQGNFTYISSRGNTYYDTYGVGVAFEF